MAKSKTIRLTTAQAIIRFLDAQYISHDDQENQLFKGCLGIFGHGNVAGIGQAIAKAKTLEYIPFRNEQAMVHTAVAHARAHRRKSIYACTSSIGPGATNMITGAALASINRIPVLLLPGDYMAGQHAGTLLQQWSHPSEGDRSVNDSFRAVSVYWDRINRPEQIIPSLLESMRILTSPAETGAVTVCLPQDVQVEAYDFPLALFDKRLWHIPRLNPDELLINKAARLINKSEHPLIIAGGGIRYSSAHQALLDFVDHTMIPVAETFAGKGSLPYDHPMSFGSIGVTGTSASNKTAQQADLVIGIGTRMTDFTTASNSLFQNPSVQFIHINMSPKDAHGQSALPLIGDAKNTLQKLQKVLTPHSRQEYKHRLAIWKTEYERDKEQYLNSLAPNTQTRYIKTLNSCIGDHDVVINASGSMPGELHQLWSASSPDQVHIEYGYSCMGYEIPAGIGCYLSGLYQRVYVLIGDGSYLMLPQEIVTAVQLDVSMTIIMMDNSGYGSIGQLSLSVGAEAIGTSHQHQKGKEKLKIDYVQNAESLGAKGYHITDDAILQTVLKETKYQKGVIFLYCKVPSSSLIENGAWWDVPIAEVSTTTETQKLRANYEKEKLNQRYYLNTDQDE